MDKIKKIIAEQLSIDENSIREDSNFKDDLGADSLDLFNLVMAFEDEHPHQQAQRYIDYEDRKDHTQLT